jgi:hypothetical protein
MPLQEESGSPHNIDTMHRAQTIFKCFNCRKEKSAQEAVLVSWPTRIGWVFVSGGIVGRVCRDCKRGVTVIGSGITLFFVCIGIAWLLYAISGVFS